MTIEKQVLQYVSQKRNHAWKTHNCEELNRTWLKFRTLDMAVFPAKYNERFPFVKKFRKFRLGCKWTRFLGSFHWKFSGINGIPEKVVRFSLWKLPNGKLLFHLKISRFCHQFQAFCGLLTGQAPSCFNKNGGWSWSIFWTRFANKLLGLLRVPATLLRQM